MILPQQKGGKAPCRVCSQFKTLTGIKQQQQQQQKTPESSKAATTATTTAPSVPTTTTTHTSPATTVPPAYSPFPCPPDSSELGRSTWTFLHTMAAYYPEAPSLAERAGMRSFLHHFSRFYPCGYCADHLRQYSLKHPPNVENNWELSQWMCQAHNEVNERQGREPFDCSRVFERWRDGSPGSEC